MFGRTAINPDPSGAFALNRWILDIGGHTMPLYTSDERDIKIWIDVARSQANPELAMLEWNGRSDPVAIGRVVGRQTLERAREAYRGVPVALAQLDSEEMEWGDNNILRPDTHYLNAEILDIAPRPIGGMTPSEREDIGSYIQLLTPRQGAWMGESDLSTIEHQITGYESIEAMKSDAKSLVKGLNSLLTGRFRVFLQYLVELGDEIERLSTGNVIGTDEQADAVLDNCDNMIDVLKTITTLLCNNNPSQECLEIVPLVRRLGRRLQMIRDEINDGIWTEVSI